MITINNLIIFIFWGLFKSKSFSYYLLILKINYVWESMCVEMLVQSVEN